MTVVRFIAYGDIHHASQAARCLNLTDTLRVEEAVHQRVQEGAFDFSVFLGDRFLKREPEDEVKVKADRCLLRCLNTRPTIPHYHLTGNHDWTRNNRDWHTSESLKGVENLHIIDEPSTHSNAPFAVHALPADVPFDMSQYQVNTDLFNLFVFHGIVRGAAMSEGHTKTFTEGIDITQIDRSEWDFVLAGDIHVPQILPFKNTKGGYAGSVLQRTRADADKIRGWLEVTATQEDSGEWVIESIHAPTRNFFHRESWDVGSDFNYEDIILDEVYVNDAAVEVRLKGDRADVDRVADDERWSNYKTLHNARNIEIIRQYQVSEDAEISIDFTASGSVQDDLSLYLGSGFANIGTLPADKIFEVIERLMKGPV